MSISNEVFVLTTTSTVEEADTIATALVERRLAACVQIIGPIASVYRWQGAVERSEERLLLVKTTADAFLRVEAAIKELHMYDCPEIVAAPIIAGSIDYLAWLREHVDVDGQ